MAVDAARSFGFSSVVADHFELVVTSQNATGPSILSSGGPNSQPCFRVQGNGTTFGPGSDCFYIKTLKTSSDTKNVAFDLKIATRTPAGFDSTIFKLRDGTTEQIDLRYNNAGDIYFTRNGTTLAGSTVLGLIQTATWIHLEFKVKIHNTTGELTLWVNGASGATFALTNLDTQNSANATVDHCGPALVNNHNGFNAAHDFANLIVTNGVRILHSRCDYFPSNAAGNSAQWTPSAGLNHQTVDEINTKDTSDYNETAVLNEVDSFDHADVSTTATILAVGPIGLMSKLDSGSCGIKHVARVNATDYTPGTEHAPPNGSFQYFQDWLDVNPDTAVAWLPAGFNAAEFGYKRTA